MFAIVKTGGKQYRVATNDKIKVEKLDVEEGKKFILSDVLFVQKDGKAVFGEPLVKGATVEAEVLKNYKDK